LEIAIVVAACDRICIQMKKKEKEEEEEEEEKAAYSKVVE
jgi:hypothetical protein